MQFDCVANVPGKRYDSVVVGNDGLIHHIQQVYESSTNPHIDWSDKSHNIKQICVTKNAKAVIAGVGQLDKPGVV